MNIITLSRTDIFYGEVNQKELDLDRNQIKYKIYESFIENKLEEKISDHLKVMNCDAMFHLTHYIIDYFLFYSNKRRLGFSKIINGSKQFGYCVLPGSSTLSKSHNKPLDPITSPDFTLVYCVDVQEGSSDLVIEYDDHRRKGRSWQFPVKNNCYYMFNSSLRYYITKNKSDRINTFFIQTYAEQRQ
tara:strand:- start:8399 stop:8959 length:561 start_codon:yes stop_codon:yes gene_type:complete